IRRAAPSAPVERPSRLHADSGLRVANRDGVHFEHALKELVRLHGRGGSRLGGQRATAEREVEYSTNGRSPPQRARWNRITFGEEAIDIWLGGRDGDYKTAQASQAAGALARSKEAYAQGI